MTTTTSTESTLVITREELRAGLAKTSRIAGSAGNADRLRAYYFIPAENGTVTLASSDMKLTLFANLKATINREFGIFSVDSKRLDDFVRNAEDTIEITPDGDFVHLKSGPHFKQRLPIKGEELFQYDFTDAEGWQEIWAAKDLHYILNSMLTIVTQTHQMGDQEVNIYLDGTQAFVFDGANIAHVPFETKEQYVINEGTARQILLLLSGQLEDQPQKVQSSISKAISSAEDTAVIGEVKVKTSATPDGVVIVMKTAFDTFSFRAFIYDEPFKISTITDNFQEKMALAIDKKTLLKTINRMVSISDTVYDGKILIDDQGGGDYYFVAEKNQEKVEDYIKLVNAIARPQKQLQFSANVLDFRKFVTSVPGEDVLLYFGEATTAGALLNIRDRAKRFSGYLTIEEV